jgi:photosynthesis system II assembly factor YCF48-like protein
METSMPLDDRDRSFEKALALRLRANPPGATCPDAETLAAYHERSLTLEELNFWKPHIASCAKCQQVLVHLEALAEVPQEAVAGQESSAETSNLVGTGARTVAAHDALPVAAPKKTPFVSVGQFPKPAAIRHWRWIAPVGAIAAGLLVWVAVHANRSATLPPAKIEIAQNRSSETEPKVAAPAERENLDTTRALPKSVPSAGDRGSASSALQNRRDLSAANTPMPKMATPAVPPGRSEAIAREAENAQLSAKSNSGQDTKISGLAGGIATGAAGAAIGGIVSDQKGKKSDESTRQDQAMNYAAAPAPAAPKPQSARQSGAPSQRKDEKQLQAKQSAGASSAGPAQTQQAPANAEALPPKIPAMAENVEVTSAPPTAPASAPPASSDALKQPSQDVNALPNVSRSSTDLLAVTSGAEAAPASRLAKSRAPRNVVAPGGKVIWRLGYGGLIEQSLDGGQTWTPQTSGTTETLFLGSAPSEQVCWVIGISGTILRTTDGGATWTRVVSPIPQNLGLIRASDALHATVWDTSRRQVFQTADGGVTWTAASAH